MHLRNIFLALTMFLFFTCSKNDNTTSNNTGTDAPSDSTSTPTDSSSIPNRSLSALGKKLIGKWRPFVYSTSPNDFWDIKDVIIDSISNNSVTYRQYVDSVQSSLCSRQGRWYEKDSVLYGTCVPNARITKLTDDMLIFRYYHEYGYVEYKWKKLK